MPCTRLTGARTATANVTKMATAWSAAMSDRNYFSDWESCTCVEDGYSENCPLAWEREEEEKIDG